MRIPKTGGVGNHLFGREFVIHGIVGARLRYFPVLTEFAVELHPAVAIESGECGRKHVKAVPFTGSTCTAQGFPKTREY